MDLVRRLPPWWFTLLLLCVPEPLVLAQNAPTPPAPANAAPTPVPPREQAPPVLEYTLAFIVTAAVMTLICMPVRRE